MIIRSSPIYHSDCSLTPPLKRIDLLKCSLRFTDKGHNFLFRVNTLERQHRLQETKHKLISYQNSQLRPHMLEQFILVRYPLQWSKTSCYSSPVYMSQIETPLQEQRRRKRKTSIILKLNETFNNDHSLLQAEDKVARVTKNKQKLLEQTGIVAIRLYLLHL